MAYLRLGNAQAAYKEAYDASGSKPETIRVKASQYLKKDNIRIRIAELQKPVIEEAQLTLAGHLKDLKDLREKAERDAKWGPAIQAEIARGKASGLYVEHVKLSGKVTGEIIYRANMPPRNAAG